MKVYICGPMRGIKHFNFPAFDEASLLLSRMGHSPVSPADIDRFRFPGHDFSTTTLPEGFDPFEVIMADLAMVNAVDAIYVLSGWEGSTGSAVEIALARYLGKQIFYQSAVPGKFARLVLAGPRSSAPVES